MCTYTYQVWHRVEPITLGTDEFQDLCALQNKITDAASEIDKQVNTKPIFEKFEEEVDLIGNI